MIAPTPKVGMRFVHARILDENNQPAPCSVSAVREGVVYYKVGDERKAKEYVTLERWPRICARVLVTAKTTAEPVEWSVVERGIAGGKITFRIGSQMFALWYEPDDDADRAKMADNLRYALSQLSAFTPGGKTASKQQAEPTGIT